MLIELVRAGLQRTEGPVAMRDGSMLVSSTGILKVDLSDNVSTFIEDSNQTGAIGWDHQGRLISVQRARGNEKVGVLYYILEDETPAPLDCIPASLTYLRGLRL